MQGYFQKVVIWGFPLYSHTHSYVHYGWYRTFQHIGYETHWFHDKDYPKEFDFTHCLFITEGYADNNIPLHPSNIYFVHVARNPKKYLQIGARFIDIRYHVSEINDCNYHYKLEGKDLQKVGSITLYEPRSSSQDLSRQYQLSSPLEYEAVYMCWATDLLPHEIRLEDRLIVPDEPKVCHFVGTVSSGNYKEINALREGCRKHGIELKQNDPWSNPYTNEKSKEMVQRSAVAPDIRGSGDPQKIALGETGTCHKKIGYIPCRLFKNISYGKVGAVNCPRLKELFGDMVVFCEDEKELVGMCLEKEKDKDYILKQMEWVKDNHTFIHRVQDILAIVVKRKPVEVAVSVSI